MNLVSQIANLVRKLSDAELYKLATESATLEIGDEPVKAKPGPKPKNGAAKPSNGAAASPTGKRRGRPAGSKNKPKETEATASAPAETAAPVKTDSPESVEVDSVLMDVEMYVRKHKGVSRGQVAEQFKIEPAAAARYLKQLVTNGKIAVGGERRFTRYAEDQKTADDASAIARGAAPSED